jgi:hypothetical protein
LEGRALLSSFHAASRSPEAVVDGSTAKLPPFVQAVKQDARRFGKHVQVETIVVPGSFTEYEITFYAKGSLHMIDLTINYPTTPGPQPG